MPTRVFKTAEFARFAAKARVGDALLVEAIERSSAGWWTPTSAAAY